MAMLSSRHICLVVVIVVCCIIQASLRAMASDSSVHSAAVNEVHLVPIDIIIRPIPPVLEEAKVNSLIKTIQVGSNDSNVERLYGIMITIHASWNETQNKVNRLTHFNFDIQSTHKRFPAKTN